MKELRVDIGGSIRGYQEAIQEAAGTSRAFQAELDRLNVYGAQRYVKQWEYAVERRDAVESAADERRIAREKATAEIIAANTTAAFERGAAARAAIQREIAGGLVPGSMAGGAERVAAVETRAKLEAAGYNIVGGVGTSLAGAYLFKGGRLAGKLDEAGELAGEGMKRAAAAEGGSVWTQLSREFVAIFDESARGQRGAMASSIGRIFTIITGAITGLALPIIAVLAGTAAIVTPSFLRYHRAKKQEEASKKSLKGMTGELADDVRNRVEGFHRMGKISDADYRYYLHKLKHGGFENVSTVENALTPLMKHGSIEQQEKQFAMQKELVRAQAAYRSELESTVNEQTRLVMIMEDEKKIRDAIAEASRSGNAAKVVELRTQLLQKQTEEQNSRKALIEAAKPKPNDRHFGIARLDMLSRAGLFTSMGAVSNPMIDEQRQTNRLLAEIRGDIRLGNGRRSIFEP